MKKQNKISKILFVSGTRADFYIIKNLFLKTSRFIPSKIVLHAGLLQTFYGNISKEIFKKISNKNIISIKTNYKKSNKSKEILKSFSNQIQKIGKILINEKPDVVTIVGDRTEALASAVAALLNKIPILHVHGGELSFGSLDERIRHAISKLSSFHFVSHIKYKKRLQQMGEKKDKIKVIGAPGLKNYEKLKFDKNFFLNTYNLINKRFVLVTLNSYLSKFETEHFARIMFRDLDKLNVTKIITYPNPDIHNQIIIDKIEKRTKRSDYRIFKYLGSEYPKFLKHCEFIVGNTSSGIIEAPYFNKIFINLGSRQNGREISKNTTINVSMKAKSLNKIFKKLLNKKKIKSRNLYYKKNCLNLFFDTLKSIDKNELEKKNFIDIL